MAVSPSDRKKKYPFDAVTKQHWLNAALPEWQGATFAEKSTSPEEGIVISPYYDYNDLPENPVAPLSVSQHSIFGARAWRNVPLIRAATDSETNRQALSALMSGADGILFEPRDDSDPEALLENIEFNFCSISFRVTPKHQNFILNLPRAMSARGYDPDTISGALFFPLSRDGYTHAADFARYPGFFSNGVSAGKNSIDDLTALLVAASRHIEAVDSSGVSIDAALKSIAFYVPVGNDFFFEIAKLKALRMLWHQAAQAWKPGYTSPVLIHAVSEPWVKDGWQPHGNLIKSTASGMSAVLGGCDALTVLPDDEGSATMQRIALNVSSVLREESHFSKVADATAGSYYLENLTAQIAGKVWKKFQLLA